MQVLYTNALQRTCLQDTSSRCHAYDKQPDARRQAPALSIVARSSSIVSPVCLERMRGLSSLLNSMQGRRTG